MAIPDIESRTVALRVSSDDFPDNYSVSSYSSGSDSWLMEDLFDNSPGFPSHNISHSSCGSSNSRLDYEEHLWRSWDADQDTFCADPLLAPIQVREQGQTRTARKLPSQIQHERTETSKLQHLKRAPATRSPRRKSRIQAYSPSTAVRTNYLPYISSEPEAVDDRQDYHMKCHSWPTPAGPLVRPQRSRANTTPAPTCILKFSRPSNLSTCTALNQNNGPPIADISILRSQPPTPTFLQFPYVPERDLMDLMVETSAFSDDEDDEPPTLKSAIKYTKSVLNLHRAAANSESEKLPVEKAKRKPRMTLRRAMSSFLSKKKGATL
ncbi:hypothetical protein WAI453_007859 [Rhynchosporium graminicola]